MPDAEVDAIYILHTGSFPATVDITKLRKTADKSPTARERRILSVYVERILASHLLPTVMRTRCTGGL